MILTDKKEVLKEIIENADDKLMSLMIALAYEYNDEEYVYSKEELDIIEKSRDVFFKSGKKGFSVEDAHENVRRNYKNRL